MKILFGLFVLFCHTNINNVLSQKSYNGSCQQFELRESELSTFNKWRYMRLWYIQATYDYPDVDGRDCMTVEYIWTSPKQAKVVEHDQNLNTNQCIRQSNLMLFDKETKGQYIYRTLNEYADDYPVYILDTDYVSYAIEWSCIPDGLNSNCYIWIMSRKRIVGDEFWALVKPVFRQHNISKDDLRLIVQDARCNCKEWN